MRNCMADLNLEINDYGQINKAKFNIKKINVVCGVNSWSK